VVFDRYLTSLAGSWEALAAPHHDARAVRGDGFVALRSERLPVLNNAAVLRPDAVPAALNVFGGLSHYAIWSADAVTAAAIAAAGLARDTTTVPMVCALTEDASSTDDGVVSGVAPEVIADISGVDADLLRGVPGLWTFAGTDLQSGLVLIPVDTDVNVGFVATREPARRRGSAARVLRYALAAALARGFRTASLQSTPVAERLYTRAGFVPVGRWQEWVPAAYEANLARSSTAAAASNAVWSAPSSVS
jgi:GNAT superfamily N-acetyltransferase